MQQLHQIKRFSNNFVGSSGLPPAATTRRRQCNWLHPLQTVFSQHSNRIPAAASAPTLHSEASDGTAQELFPSRQPQVKQARRTTKRIKTQHQVQAQSLQQQFTTEQQTEQQTEQEQLLELGPASSVFQQRRQQQQPQLKQDQQRKKRSKSQERRRLEQQQWQQQEAQAQLQPLQELHAPQQQEQKLACSTPQQLDPDSLRQQHEHSTLTPPDSSCEDQQPAQQYEVQPHDDADDRDHAAHNTQATKRSPSFRVAADTKQAELTSALIRTLRRDKRLTYYAAGDRCIYKALRSLAFARPFLNHPELGLDVLFQVNMSGHPLDPRRINKKVCLPTFSIQYVEGVETLFGNKGKDPYFVNKRNDLEKIASVIIAMVHNDGHIVLQSIGSQGVTQMMRAIASARRRLLPKNEDVCCMVRAYREELPPSEVFPNGHLVVRVAVLVIRCLPYQPLQWVMKPLVPDAAADSTLAAGSGNAKAATVYADYVPPEALQGWDRQREQLEDVASRQLALLADDETSRNGWRGSIENVVLLDT